MTIKSYGFFVTIHLENKRSVIIFDEIKIKIYE